MAAPAAAAETNPSGKQAAGVVGVKTASAPVGRHHAWPRWRVTSWETYHVRYADAAPDGLQPVYWSGRPVLLMIGIGY